MKKYVFIILCIALCGCDNKNNNMTGYCVRNDYTVTTTEQDGQFVERKTTYIKLCKCHNTENSDSFMIPAKEFSFTESYTESTFNDNIPPSQPTPECDKQCAKLCKKK